MRKQINATEVFQWNYDAYYNSDKKYIINDGGSRSSKAYSICQLLVFIALQSKVTINVVRKELRVLKDTFMKQDLIPMLIEYGIFNAKKI